jgi:hypothetical protein
VLQPNKPTSVTSFSGGNTVEAKQTVCSSSSGQSCGSHDACLLITISHVPSHLLGECWKTVITRPERIWRKQFLGRAYVATFLQMLKSLYLSDIKGRIHWGWRWRVGARGGKWQKAGDIYIMGGIFSRCKCFDNGVNIGIFNVYLQILFYIVDLYSKGNIFIIYFPAV